MTPGLMQVANQSKRLKQMSAEVSAARKASRGGSGSSSARDKPAGDKPANRRGWVEKEVELASALYTAKQTLEKELSEKQAKSHEIQMLNRQVFSLRKREAAPESIERLEVGAAFLHLQCHSSVPCCALSHSSVPCCTEPRSVQASISTIEKQLQAKESSVQELQNVVNSGTADSGAARCPPATQAV